jgi:hypothetical protein
MLEKYSKVQNVMQFAKCFLKKEQEGARNSAAKMAGSATAIRAAVFP